MTRFVEEVKSLLEEVEQELDSVLENKLIFTFGSLINSIADGESPTPDGNTSSSGQTADGTCDGNEWFEEWQGEEG